MSNDDTIEIEDLKLYRETEKAYLVCDPDGHQAWIPKSQVVNIQLGKIVRVNPAQEYTEIRILEIPEWLADQKELF